jgi:lipopolysaccharide transport system ATP-binding protein
MQQAAISLDSVSKKFRIRHSRPRTLRESLIRRVRGKADSAKIIWALRNISFQITPGQTVGIIGHNGAGKSTLLRLLCGVGLPTSGSIKRSGAISGLLELGTGFHPLRTGRENVRTAAMLNGLTKQQVKNLEPEMIAFAELEDFIDEPVRTYSSGMYLRLAFAAAIHLNPDILVIDEVLTVGDEAFQQKCIHRLERYRQSGKTLVITSHETDQVQRICDHVLVLEEGELVYSAEPQSAIQRYKELLRLRSEKRAHLLGDQPATILEPENESGKRMGTQEVRISEFHIYGKNRNMIQTLTSDSPITIEFAIDRHQPVPDVAITLGVFTEKDTKCFETVLRSVKASIGNFGSRLRVTCQVPELNLQPGQYFINVGLFPTDFSFSYDFHYQIHSLRVTGRNPDLSGIVLAHPIWKISE